MKREEQKRAWREAKVSYLVSGFGKQHMAAIKGILYWGKFFDVRVSYGTFVCTIM